MAVEIFGIGTAVPSRAIDQTAAADVVQGRCCNSDEERRALSALFRRSGVKSRRSVILGEDGATRDLAEYKAFYPERNQSSDQGPTTRERMAIYAREAKSLALEAASRCLQESRIPLSEIDQLVTVSCSGFDAPGVDAALPGLLGLSPLIGRTHIGFMGCHGSLNGLRVARAFCEADPGSRVLVCSVELCSLHLQYGWDRDKVVANALFSDGAGAVVLGRRRSDEGKSPSEIPIPWKLASSGSMIFPDSVDAMSWKVGDHGFSMTLSPRVPELIEEGLAPWMSSWLEKSGYRLDEIPSWAVHPGGPRILRSVEKSLQLSREQTGVSHRVLEKLGNMSSATVFFILSHLMKDHAPLPCVAVGFGPGLAVEAALFTE